MLSAEEMLNRLRDAVKQVEMELKDAKERGDSRNTYAHQITFNLLDNLYGAFKYGPRIREKDGEVVKPSER